MKTWNPPKFSKTMTLSQDCCSRALSEESGTRISMCMPWTSLRVRDSMWKRMLARMPTWHWSACITDRNTMQALHDACMDIYIDVNGACAPACCDMRAQDLSSGIAFFAVQRVRLSLCSGSKYGNAWAYMHVLANLCNRCSTYLHNIFTQHIICAWFCICVCLCLCLDVLTSVWRSMCIQHEIQ